MNACTLLERKTTMTNGETLDRIMDDLKITKISPRESAAGTWVDGTSVGYRFSALVFPEHAECESYEYGQSRISKLWVQRLADRETTFNFDRGLDVEAQDETTEAIVGLLTAGLAEHVFGN
jgi:hypothetical protein